MRRFRTSIAAWSMIGHGLLFLLLMIILPDTAFKFAGYALVLGAGFAALFRWYRDFFYALREGRGGASFLIIGTFSLISIVWFHRLVVVGQATWPDVWLFEDDFLIRLGVWYLGWSLLMLFFAPDINSGVVPPKSFFTLSVGIAFGSFMMGYSFAVGTTAPEVVPTRPDTDSPICADNRPVWGSANGIYHLPTSVYRNQMNPVKCFKTDTEAERKGFRALKGQAAD